MHRKEFHLRIALIASSLLLLSTAAAPIDPDVLAIREAAWRAWFGGDEAALRAMLPDDFLAISAGGEIAGREKTIASSLAFKEAGGRLLSLSFPETQAQRFGDTVVLYGSYDATFFDGKKETAMRGRLTEVFVKRDGKWMHPGWHLDALSRP
jgi:uncharacterized protein DUF4440